MLPLARGAFAAVSCARDPHAEVHGAACGLQVQVLLLDFHTGSEDMWPHSSLVCRACSSTCSETCAST
eukprot:scaffold3404_cov277-Prasinococcus_capsulatus_cf.AAC.2